MKNIFRALAATAALFTALPSQASIVFTFTEANNNVTMTSSGTLDLNKLVQVDASGWADTGLEHNSAYDVMGSTAVDYVDSAYAFHAGTIFSAWSSKTGPWGASNFNVDVINGVKPFATVVYDAQIKPFPGIQVASGDVVNGLWSPDQDWTWLGTSFSDLKLIAGSYTVADAVTGESITFQIGAARAVPEPGSIALAGLGLAALAGIRRRKA